MEDVYGSYLILNLKTNIFLTKHKKYVILWTIADVAELVDALDLGSSELYTCESSSLSDRTKTDSRV